MTLAESGILLHVGLTKTGTTTLQKTLFAGHSQVYYLGKLEPSKIPKGCRSMAVHDLLKRALWQLKKPLDVKKTRNLYEEQLLPEVLSGKLFVGSWEAFGMNATDKFTERLKRLQAIFGRCRIMVTLRNPLTWTPSEFLQNIEGHFLQRNHSWMGSVPFLDIEDWFEKRVKFSRGIHNFLSYSQNIQSAVSLLGRENVGISLFEELKVNPEEYYHGICRFMGIDEKEGLQLSRQKHFNQRISQQQIDFLRKVSTSWWWRVLIQRKSIKERRRLFQSIAEKHPDNAMPAKISLTSRLEREIVAATREGNRWLVENLSLPLDKYNYPF